MNLRIPVLLLALVLARNTGFAQCGPIDFDLPSSACIDQEIRVSPAGSYLNQEWDFCSADFENNPTGELFLSSAGSAFNVELVEEEGEYFGFYLSRNQSKLFRLDFGADPHATPVPVDLGGLGVSSTTWLTVHIVKEGQEYIGFAIDFFNKVYRFRFGSSVALLPGTAEIIYADGLLATPIDMKVVEDESGKYLFIANAGANVVTRLDFGSSFDSAPGTVSADQFVVTGSGNLSGISFIRECAGWFALATSTGGGQITKIFFNNGLASATPVCTPVSGLSFTPSSPGAVSLVYENANYYGLIQSQASQSDLYRINFGASLTDGTLSESTNLGDLGVLSNVFGFSSFKIKSDWLIFASENVGQRIFKIVFPNRCLDEVETSVDTVTTLRVGASGTYSVSLTVKDANNVPVAMAKQIAVSALTSPDIVIESGNMCAQHDVFLSYISIAGNIQSTNWDFGDASPVSPDVSPAHIYASAGSYEVRLDVMASNGCENTAYRTISVYDPAVADFRSPTGFLCTNNELTFINETVDTYEGNLGYAWTVQGVEVSNTRDLHFALPSPGDINVALKVFIPGCEDEAVTTLVGVETGPAGGFVITGKCEDTNITFTNSSSGAIASYSWNLGNGAMSTEANAATVYPSPGVYNVTLNVLGTNGCVTTVAKDLTVYSNPVPNFSLDLPPFSCSGSPSQFRDATPTPNDSNLQSWLWNFGDQTSGTTQNPVHIYSQAQQYTAGLTVTTDKGCSASVSMPITISPSPGVNFNHDPACVNQATHLTGSSAASIKSWQWQVGTVMYNQQNVDHVFSSAATYPAKLTVTANNNCVNSITRQVVVPVVPTIDINIENGCAGQQTRLVAAVGSPSDLAAGYKWTLGGDVVDDGPTITHTFSQIGSYPVQLEVTMMSGCVYAYNESVSVYPVPSAVFSPTEVYGPAPLTVTFTNTSTGASSYLWHLGDAGSSSDQSPTTTYSQLGTYLVTLEATSDKGCVGSADGMVNVIVPHADLSVNGFSLFTDPVSGTTQGVLRLRNNGNYPATPINLIIDAGAGVLLTETVTTPIGPQTEVTLMTSSSLEFQSGGSGFICITASVAADADLNNNRQCLTVEEISKLFEPYPNPSNGRLSLEIISPLAEEVTINIVNSNGADAYSKVVDANAGLNVFELDLSTLSSGIYIIRVSTSSSVVLSRRIAIQR